LNYQLTLDEAVGMPANHTQPPGNSDRVKVRTVFCVPEDQEKFLPKRRRAPAHLPVNAPLPRQGEVVYLSSSSAWAVSMVIHQWHAPTDLCIEVWLVHVATSRDSRPPGFALTQ